MFDRIEMDIVDMPGEIAVVADGVLPEPSLPKREIAIRPALEIEACSDQCVAEIPLDPAPAAREIRVV